MTVMAGFGLALRGFSLVWPARVWLRLWRFGLIQFCLAHCKIKTRGTKWLRLYKEDSFFNIKHHKILQLP